MTPPSRVSGVRSGITTLLAAGPSWFGSDLKVGLNCDANLLWRTTPLIEGLSTAWKTGLLFSSQHWSIGPSAGFLVGRRLANSVNVMGDISVGILLGRQYHVEAVPSLGVSFVFPRLLNRASLVPFVRTATEFHFAYPQQEGGLWNQAVGMSLGFKWDI